MGKVIGIDLGTTNSVVAILDGSQPEIVANSAGARTTPSVVSLGTSDEWLVGDVAKRQLANRPEHTVYSVKRPMGMRYDEVSEEDRRQQLQAPAPATENGLYLVPKVIE